MSPHQKTVRTHFSIRTKTKDRIEKIVNDDNLTFSSQGNLVDYLVAQYTKEKYGADENIEEND